MLLSEQSKIIKEHQRRAPVRVAALADALGLKVYSTARLSPDVSGMIKIDLAKGGQSGYAIYVNGSHAETRKRFTIAHEIAHFILHKNLIGDGIVEDALLRARGLSNSVERQANGLAADILMPWHLLEPAIPNNTIEDLASMFKVSRDAMSYRVLGVSYDDAQANGRV
jgi:hypothetical protein